jgi:hypothetical protein
MICENCKATDLETLVERAGKMVCVGCVPVFEMARDLKTHLLMKLVEMLEEATRYNGDIAVRVMNEHAYVRED